MSIFTQFFQSGSSTSVIKSINNYNNMIPENSDSLVIPITSVYKDTAVLNFLGYRLSTSHLDWDPLEYLTRIYFFDSSGDYWTSVMAERADHDFQNENVYFSFQVIEYN